jgi:hypothetical protein
LILGTVSLSVRYLELEVFQMAWIPSAKCWDWTVLPVFL